jgi:hypothetical protein
MVSLGDECCTFLGQGDDLDLDRDVEPNRGGVGDCGSALRLAYSAPVSPPGRVDRDHQSNSSRDRTY